MIEAGQYHLVGVAGVGMSSLALAVLGQKGCRVTGSDRYWDRGESVESIPKLLQAGVEMVKQDGSGVRPDTRAVVISTAIEDDNPEIVRARALQIPVLHRSELLQRLLAGHTSLAVTGTSGKSTVTGMIGWMLEVLGADPSVVNGAPVLNWMEEKHLGNARIGASDFWVIEADESDRSLVNYRPDWVVITNVSLDHFSLEEAQALFRKFAASARKGAVSALDSPAWLQGFHPEVKGLASSFSYGGVRFEVPLPGVHNAENAQIAVVTCERLGYSLPAIAMALKSFRGIHRRMEQVGVARGVTVVDDYAHNPAKISATWKALRDVFDRVRVIWRPHGYKPLSLMMDELTASLSFLCRPQDGFYLLPVYDAGGTANRTVHSGLLAEKLAAKGVPVQLVEKPETLPAQLAADSRAGDVIVTMGARDPALPALARQILSAVAASHT